MIQDSKVPAWPTMLRSRLRDGRLMGTDGSVWVYRSVPMAPVLDARTPLEGLSASEPVLNMFEELSAMTSISIPRRSIARSAYREVHLLLVNLPRHYEPPRDHPNYEYLRKNFGNVASQRRVLLFGVRLKDKVGGGNDGLNGAISSVVETMVGGGTPLSDYDADTKRILTAMDHAGLQNASREEIALANAWWNHGHFPDTPFLLHADHLHVFRSAEGMRIADEVGVEDCREWREKKVPDTHAVSFASVQDLELPFLNVTEPSAAWVSELVSAGAVAVSIRGQVEPAAVTRAELRRQKKRYLDDINERVKQNKMERAEQSEMLQQLAGVEAMYAVGTNPSPTLAGTSVLVALDGQVGDINAVLGNSSLVKLSLMLHRQPGAMAEMMLCSGVRSNPNLHDFPIQVVGCSGISSLNLIGDTDGALLGFDERDRQPAMISPSAASAGDALPMMLVAGATGSGKTIVLLDLADQFARMGRPVVIVDPKAMPLNTPIPTPSGWSTISDLKVGDTVFGRDGQACTVTGKSQVFTTDQTTLYEFVLDDGQVLKADAHHLWVTYANNDRSRFDAASEEDKIEWSQHHTHWAEIVDGLAISGMDGEAIATSELLTLLRGCGVTKWNDLKTLSARLQLSGLTPDRSKVQQAYWARDVALKVIAGILRLEADAPFGQVLTTEQMVAIGVKRGSQTRWALPVHSGVYLPDANVPIAPYVLGTWLGDGHANRSEIFVGDMDLDDTVRLVTQGWPRTRVAKTKGACSIIHLERDLERCLYGHDAYVPVNRGDRMSQRCSVCEREHQVAGRAGEIRLPGEMVNPTWIHLLRSLGIYGNKRIPNQYQRASKAQRMGLLQGLMDTDGTTKRRGDLRISLMNESLSRDVLELVRGLGYKATIWEGDATLTESDPDNPGKTRVRVVGRQWQVTFRTSDPMFRLPRKLAIQKARDRRRPTGDRSHWHYVKEIREVAPEPVQCIRVDSADHTYLVEGFVTSHNTGSDHSPTVLAAGGQVASLDALLTADGVFDPIRFSAVPAVGVELAASMLMSINPWGDYKSNMEVPLQHALSYGVSQGAQCIGQALEFAKRDLQLPEGLVERVDLLAQASPQFRAIVGVNPSTEGLRAAAGITLIKVGDAYLDLPEPGVPPDSINQRIALALVRMMVFGSAMALTGRDGAVMLDEAWMFLGAGRSEIERLGRLARSQQVLPMLFTQRVTDALNAGLAGYISRGLILSIEDAGEAAAACELYKLEQTPQRMARITAKGTLGGTSASGAAPNWTSLKALRHPTEPADPRNPDGPKKVIRGSIGIYVDLTGRAIPVEVKLSDEFLALASTNPEDIRRRKEMEASEQVRLAAARANAPRDLMPDAGGGLMDRVF